MSSEWIETDWGSIATLEYGKGLRDYRSGGGAYPVYGTNGQVGHCESFLCPHAGIVVGRKGAYRGIHYSANPFYVIDTAYWLKPKIDLDLKWAYYELLRQDINSLDSGSAIPSTTRDAFYSLDVFLPPIEEQKEIAHILGTLDDKIELNRKTNETLEAMAKALFNSWFVDFDPVRAKVEGRPTGLPAEISDLFPDSFEDSELGEIPSGWRVGCLSDCCEITMGQSPPGDTYNDEGDGLPFYQGKTDFGFRFPGRRIYCSSHTRQASIGATLISVRAPVGSANIAREVCSIGRGIAALKSRQSADSFIYYLIGTLQGVFESYNSEGTVFGAINGKDLASIQVVAPSTEAVAAFNSQCLPMDESIQSNTLETEHLTTIRDTLLPKLISGEIRIPDAEKMLEEVGV